MYESYDSKDMDEDQQEAMKEEYEDINYIN